MTDVTTEEGESRGAVDPNVVTEEGRKWYKENRARTDEFIAREGKEGCQRFTDEFLADFSHFTFEQFAKSMEMVAWRYGRDPYSTQSTAEFLEGVKRDHGHCFKKSL